MPERFLDLAQLLKVLAATLRRLTDEQLDAALAGTAVEPAWLAGHTARWRARRAVELCAWRCDGDLARLVRGAVEQRPDEPLLHDILAALPGHLLRPELHALAGQVSEVWSTEDAPAARTSMAALAVRRHLLRCADALGRGELGTAELDNEVRQIEQQIASLEELLLELGRPDAGVVGLVRMTRRSTERNLCGSPGGLVAEGEHLILRQPAMVVVLEPDHREQEVTTWQAQLDLAERIDHLRVVRAWQRGRSRLGAWVSRPRLEGGSVSLRLRRRWFNTRRALDVGHQMADILAAAHRLGIAHGSLDPAQVLFDKRDQVWIGGFQLGPAGRTGTRPRGRVFQAPERRGGAPPSPAADTWALGVLCATLLLGELPTQQPGEASDSGVTGLLARAGLGPELIRLIDRLTHAEPGERPSAEAARLALLAILEAQPSERRAAPKAPPPWRNSQALLLGSLLGAWLALALPRGRHRPIVVRAPTPTPSPLVIAETTEPAEPAPTATPEAGREPPRATPPPEAWAACEAGRAVAIVLPEGPGAVRYAPVADVLIWPPTLDLAFCPEQGGWRGGQGELRLQLLDGARAREGVTVRWEAPEGAYRYRSEGMVELAARQLLRESPWMAQAQNRNEPVWLEARVDGAVALRAPVQRIERSFVADDIVEFALVGEELLAAPIEGWFPRRSVELVDGQRRRARIDCELRSCDVLPELRRWQRQGWLAGAQLSLALPEGEHIPVVMHGL